MAAPGAPAAAPPLSPLDALNEALSHFECASLRGRLPPGGGAPIVSGTIPDPDEKAWLAPIAQRYFPNTRPQVVVDIVPAPLCRSLATLAALRRAGLLGDSDLALRLVNATPQLREGDPIKVEVRAPSYGISVRIDYFSLDGRVQHLWPNDQEPDPKLAAKAVHVFGEPGAGKVWKAGGAPFGTEVIAVIASASPLDLGRRPWIEQSQDYLHDLRGALAATSSSPEPNIFQTLLVNTRAR
ncbi:MAG: DUF4384 domain-containing protein [Alphaproteobacteria bacterium]|nr:DUF4384 domain-containing protein [Alphaproteobacteria bacterium]